MKISVRRGAVLAGTALAALTALTGCSAQPGSGRCVETELVVLAVTVADPDKPVTLPATLKGGGQPLSGVKVGFFVHGEPKAGGQSFGKSIGDATTGADGVAKLELKGVTGLVFSTERITGYSTKFVAANKIEGVEYCTATAQAELRVP